MFKQLDCAALSLVVVLLLISTASQAGNGGFNAIGDIAATNEGVPVAIDITANDTLTFNPHTVLVTTKPINGDVVLDINNIATYTPKPGFFGQDSFVYTVSFSDIST